MDRRQLQAHRRPPSFSTCSIILSHQNCGKTAHGRESRVSLNATILRKNMNAAVSDFNWIEPHGFCIISICTAVVVVAVAVSLWQWRFRWNRVWIDVELSFSLSFFWCEEIRKISTKYFVLICRKLDCHLTWQWNRNVRQDPTTIDTKPFPKFYTK